MTLDAPLQTALATGESIRLSGALSDSDLTRILFRFTPTAGGEPIRFFLDVVEGRFDQSILFNHNQANEYELEIFAGQQGQSLPFLGGFAPFAVNQSSGVIEIPPDFFPNLTLDKTLPNQFDTGTSLRVSGTLSDSDLTQILFRFTPTAGSEPIRFFFDVVEGRFDQFILFNHNQANEYELEIFAGQQGQSLSHLGDFLPVQVLQGQGEILLPTTYFQGLTLDAPLSNQLRTGTSLDIGGTLTDTSVTQVSFDFYPTDDGDAIYFYFDVIDGRFDGHLLFDHQQVGEYELRLYDLPPEGWRLLGDPPTVQILEGQGEIYLPIDFFPGIILDAPLATEHPIGHLLVLEGKVANHILNFDFKLENKDHYRYLEASMEEGRFRLPLRFHADELGPLQVTAYAELVDGERIALGSFLFTAVDSPAPELQVGILALSLLPGESVMVPLLNRGEEDLELSPPLIEGPYEVISFPTAIEPGGRGALEIAYRGNGDERGELKILSNDPLQPELKVALSGLRPADQGVDLAHFRPESDGLISIPWDFSTGHFVLALYSGQINQVDTDAVYDFSLGGTAPAAKPIATGSLMTRRDKFEMLLRRQEQEQANRIRAEGWRASKLVRAAYQVGDKRSFIFEKSDLVSKQTIFATAVAVNERAVAFVQDDLRANSDNIDNAQIQHIIDSFRDDFEVVTDIFGTPSDVDGDGKVLFLFTHLVDDAGVGGFYQSSSVLSVENGGNGNSADMMFVSPTQSASFYRALLVHEFQHLINFNQHVIVRSGQAEESWLNEGLSHLSEDLVENGFKNGGNSDLIHTFLADPAAAGLTGNATGSDAKRGATYLFVRSLVDRLGPNVIRRLVQTGLADRDNIETASGEKFENLLALWAAQLYASGTGLVEHPRLNYAFEFLQTPTGRGFPLPTALQFSPGAGPIGGVLRARGVNFVEVRGEGSTTIELETEAAGQIGAVVLPLAKDFVPTLMIPSNYFSQILFDTPLNTAITTGQEILFKGQIEEAGATQISIDFVPLSGEPGTRSERTLAFYADIIDGRFQRSIVFNHDQADSYELKIYVGKSGESLPFRGSFAPIRVAEGAGRILLPPHYFSGITLDAALPTLVRASEPHLLGGRLRDSEQTQVLFRFTPSTGNEPIRFFIDVDDGVFAQDISFTSDQIGSYILEVFAGERFQTLSWLDTYDGFAVLSQDSVLPADAVQTPILGDLDADGKLSIVDALFALQAALGIRDLNAEQTQNADLNRNGRLDLVDALFILQASFGQRVLGKAVVAAERATGAPVALEGRIETAAKNLDLLVLSIPDRPGGACEIELRFDPQLFEFAQPTPPLQVHRATLSYTHIPEPGILQVMGISGGENELRFNLHFRRRSETASAIAVSTFRYYDANGQQQPTTTPRSLRPDLSPLPEYFALHPNFPNPFNSATQIRYELPAMGNDSAPAVHLAIYNLMGQKIRTLLDQPQEPGYYTTIWDGSDERGLPVSSGVYFYRIAVGEQILSRPLLLLR